MPTEQIHWEIKLPALSDRLNSLNFGSLEELEGLTADLLASLEKHLGGTLKPFQVFYCREDPFCNTDAVALAPNFKPLDFEFLEVRCCLTHHSQSQKVGIYAYLQFFSDTQLVTPFPPHHNAVIALRTEEVGGRFFWTGGWVYGDGPGEWEGPPQKEKYDNYQRFVYKDRDWYLDEVLGNLAAKRMQEAKAKGEKPIAWEEIKTKYSL